MINPTSSLIALALDATLMREEAMAFNIANINNPDSKPLGVAFETLIKDKSVDEILEQEITPAATTQNEPVAIDDLMRQNIENTTHFHALIRAINHQLSIEKLAMSGEHV